MSRRSASGLQAIAIAAVVALLLFGIYSYNDLHGRLRTSDEKVERLKTSQDTLSAQLQVVYEHKARLEKSLQQEKEDHAKTKQANEDEKKIQETRVLREKTTLNEKINALTAENKRLQTLYDDIRSDLDKQQEKNRAEEEENKKFLEQNKLEYMQMKQEKENEVAQLRDEIANQKRRNAQQQSDVKQHQKNNAIDQVVDVDQNVRQRGGGGRLERDLENNEPNNNPVARKNIKQNIPDQEHMQIAKPDNKPKAYFDPKSVKPDDRVKVHDSKQNADDNLIGRLEGNGAGAGLALQVIPPKVDDDVQNVKRIDSRKGDHGRQGADMPGMNVVRREDHVRQPPGGALGFGGDARGVGGLKPADNHILNDQPDDNLALRRRGRDDEKDVPQRRPHDVGWPKVDQIAVPHVQPQPNQKPGEDKPGEDKPGDNNIANLQKHKINADDDNGVNDDDQPKEEDKDYDYGKNEMPGAQPRLKEQRGPNVGPVEDDAGL